jgi:ABC-type multidrug transport system permease subunit
MPIILILIMIVTIATLPRSHKETFRLALLSALVCLIPIPIVQFIAMAPIIFERPRFSLFMVGEVTVSIIYGVLGALMIAGIVCLLSAWINAFYERSFLDRRH